MDFGRRSLLAILSVVLTSLVGTAGAFAAAETVQTEALVSFEIKDQFGNSYTDEPYREGVVVVIGSDRKGSAYSREWSTAIRESLESLTLRTEVRLLPLGHMKGVPRLLRGFVRRQFPKHPDAWVLLDWKGVFEEAYGYEKDSSTILVFLDGVMVHRTFGQELEQDKVDGIQSALERALGDEPSQAPDGPPDDPDERP